MAGAASVLRAAVTGSCLDVAAGSTRSGTAFDALNRCTATDAGASTLRATARAGANGRTAVGLEAEPAVGLAAVGATASAADSAVGIGS
ncbi:hypothetical protein [Streptacidiphilus fuscans]|uniref:Uncharacterized protein n=1 Tax=Streptacidiphilus fuscans TaxID=2789292 RepID=A0A931B3U6_9ACTN|nr:hypothetical protein [Streptacidiphilus fuscans]MBF9069834.1 hypothetical protein [Streptacidiphilus fuscans]